MVLSVGRGAIILKRNFCIKKREAEAARSRVQNRSMSDLMSSTNDMWMSSAMLCAGQRRISKPKLSYAYRGARRGGLGRAREQGWGARTWPCTRLGKQAWVPRACSSRLDIQARIDVDTRCTRGDAHVTERENVAVNVAL